MGCADEQSLGCYDQLDDFMLQSEDLVFLDFIDVLALSSILPDKDGTIFMASHNKQT